MNHITSQSASTPVRSPHSCDASPILVPCSLCNGLAKVGRRVTVYEHGCGFPHDDVEEDDCPECEGAGQLLVDGALITLEDLEDMAGDTYAA